VRCRYASVSSFPVLGRDDDRRHDSFGLVGDLGIGRQLEQTGGSRETQQQPGRPGLRRNFLRLLTMAHEFTPRNFNVPAATAHAGAIRSIVRPTGVQTTLWSGLSAEEGGPRLRGVGNRQEYPHGAMVLAAHERLKEWANIYSVARGIRYPVRTRAHRSHVFSR